MAGYRGKDLAYLKIATNELTNTKGDLSIAITNGEIDVRDDDSAGYNEAIMGDQTIVISGSFNYQKEADTATAQLALIDAAFDQTSSLALEWAYETTSGARKYTGTGFVTDCSSTNGDPETFSFSIRVESAPTEGTQT